MLKNYLLFTIKELAHQRLYTAINVIGLAAGLACCLLILLFVRHELSYETMFADAGRTYRLNWASLTTGDRFATYLNPVGPMLAEEFPEIEDYTRFANFPALIALGERREYQRVAFADPNFLAFFGFPFVAGDPESALANPNSIVLTEAAAARYFGDQDPIGQVLEMDTQLALTVTGVIHNLPDNTHLTANFITTLDALRTLTDGGGFLDNTGSDQLYQYLRLTPGADADALRAKLPDFEARHLSEGFAEAIETRMQVLTDIHFTPDLQNEAPQVDEMTGTSRFYRNKSDIYLFILVALFTLAIACFNFMNLQIVQASGRSREIGLRKTLGADRTQIAMQFIFESLILSAAAFLLSLVLVDFALPWLNRFLGVRFSLSHLFAADALGLSLLAVVASGMLAGIYPALSMAGIPPGRVLHGESFQNITPSRLRQVLVIGQFAISIGMIIAATVVYKQIQYAKSLPQGYERDQIVNFSYDRSLASFETFRTRLLEHPGIVSVTASSSIPTRSLSDGFGYSVEGRDPDFMLSTRSITVAWDFFKTFGIDLVAGRPFSEDLTTDMASFPTDEEPVKYAALILNETAARQAGWVNPEDAIGKRLYNEFSANGIDRQMNWTVIGVVRDVHFRSIRSEIVPMSYYLRPNPQIMSVKLSGQDVEGALAHIDAVWTDLQPGYPIDRSFLDEAFDTLYAVEARTFELFLGFTAVAIIIACLGLFGLASFAAERRTREVGLRKVMGASVPAIVHLLSWDFSKLVVLANLIAWPAAWYFMSRWLQKYAYQVDVGLATYVMAAVAAFAVALVTVGARALSAARANPVNSLRHE